MSPVRVWEEPPAIFKRDLPSFLFIMSKIPILIPAHNEAATIGKTLLATGEAQTVLADLAGGASFSVARW